MGRLVSGLQVPCMSLAYRSLENGLSDDSIFGHVGYLRLLCGFVASVVKLIVLLLELMYWAVGLR